MLKFVIVQHACHSMAADQGNQVNDSALRGGWGVRLPSKERCAYTEALKEASNGQMVFDAVATTMDHVLKGVQDTMEHAGQAGIALALCQKDDDGNYTTPMMKTGNRCQMATSRLARSFCVSGTLAPSSKGASLRSTGRPGRPGRFSPSL